MMSSRTQRRPAGLPLALVAMILLAGCSGDRRNDHWPGRIAYGEPERICTLGDRRVRESSGLACSRRQPGVFWTHNDSGGMARLYAFDQDGRARATLRLVGITAVDWEDAASVTLDGRHYLLVADTGDNARHRTEYAIHVVEEPELPDPPTDEPLRATAVRTITFTFEDGSQDGEALAVDPAGKTLFVGTRFHDVPRCDVYRLPFPENDIRAAVARKIATLPIEVGNAMDISPDGRRAIVGSYGDAYEYLRRPDEPWSAAFGRPARRLPMPRRRKGEAVAYGPDGKTLYLTSEGVPCPVWKVPALERERP